MQISVASSEELATAVATISERQSVTEAAVARLSPEPLSRRVMAMFIGKPKAYDDPSIQSQIARFPLAILGFFRGWHGDSAGSLIRPALQAIKSQNPAIKLGQYTIQNEAGADTKGASGDLADKLNAENWWLRNSAGAQMQYIAKFNTFDINFTEFTKPDAQGLRWPQWLARRDFSLWFEPIPEFDIWYHDNCMGAYRGGPANWRGDGDVVRTDPAIVSAWRRGMAAHWAEAQRLAPGKLFIGNVDTDQSAPEYVGRLDAGFCEGAIGRDWSLENWSGWSGMAARVRAVEANTRLPEHCTLHAMGAGPADYRTMRYGLTTALLGQGRFFYSDGNDDNAYGKLSWFDEYDIRLGKPIEPARILSGYAMRLYEGGAVVVNTTKPADKALVGSPVTIDLKGYGLRRFLGTQDSVANDGKPSDTLTLAPRDGRVLVRV